jgi:EmrB/QacA subfamily drug resistance transporter
MQQINTQSPSHKTAFLVVSCITAFLTPFIGSSVNIALPAIGREFNTDAVLLSWVATSYLLSAAVFLVPFGRIADIHGMKRIFISGLVIYTLSSILAALALSPAVLITSRIIQGVGGAMIFGTGTALLVSAYPLQERGRVLGINVAFVYIGLSAGPFVGGLMTQYLGWRSIFWLNALLGLLPIIITLWQIRGEWAHARGEKLDLPGSAIYGLGLVAIIFGFSALPDWTGFASLAAGTAIIVAFVHVELRTEHPVLNIWLFVHNRVFGFSNLAAFVNYAATFGVGFLLSLYLQYIKQLPPQAAGLVLVAMPVVQAAFSPLAGRLSDRFEPRLIASSGMAVTAAGLLLLVFLDGDTQLWFIIMSLVLLGFGFALFSSPNTNAVMSSVEKRSLSIASATLGTMRLTGQMFSMGIAMLIISVVMGRVSISPEFYLQFLLSMRYAFIIFTLLCFGGIFASMARGN